MTEEKAETAKPSVEVRPSPPSASAIPSPTASPTAHSPYRRATDLLQRLAPGKIRIGFFLGCGCPLAVRIEVDGKPQPLIPEIVGLTKQVKEHLDGKNELRSEEHTSELQS